MKKVVLVKKAADGRGLPAGTEYEYTYVSYERHIAENRASKALLRDHPHEKRESWELAPDPVAKVLKNGMKKKQAKVEA